jgi:hypothetical protein
MTVTITGAVTIGGQQYPVQTQIELPDTARSADRPETPAKPPNHLRVLPQVS